MQCEQNSRANKQQNMKKNLCFVHLYNIRTMTTMFTENDRVTVRQNGVHLNSVKKTNHLYAIQSNSVQQQFQYFFWFFLIQGLNIFEFTLPYQKNTIFLLLLMVHFSETILFVDWVTLFLFLKLKQRIEFHRIFRYCDVLCPNGPWPVDSIC